MRIAIIGTGQIGTSLGLALRAAASRSKRESYELWGYDRERRHGERARELGAIDKLHGDLRHAVDGADLVVLAVPVDQLRDTLRLVGAVLKPNATVTDTCRLKGPVLQWAAQALPGHVSFIGGDPWPGPLPAGAPTASPEAASATLFNNAPYCLVPAVEAQEQAIQLVGDLVRVVGGRPVFMDAAEHDGIVTAVNTLPAVLAAALLQAVTQGGAWRDLRRAAGQSFADMTAVEDPVAWREAVLLGQASIVPWIDALVGELETLRARIVAADGEGLTARLQAAQDQRAAWLADWHKGNWPDLGDPASAQGLPDLGDAFSRFLLGSILGRSRPRGGPQDGRDDQK